MAHWCTVLHSFWTSKALCSAASMTMMPTSAPVALSRKLHPEEATNRPLFLLLRNQNRVNQHLRKMVMETYLNNRSNSPLWPILNNPHRPLCSKMGFTFITKRLGVESLRRMRELLNSTSSNSKLKS